MPFIEENNLVNLHKLIEKGEKDLDLASEEIKNKTSKLQSVYFFNKILIILAVFLLFGLLYTLYYFYNYNNNVQVVNHETTITKQPEIVNTIFSTNINKGLLYSVQIGAFEKFNIKAIEEHKTGVITKSIVNNNYKYAVGNFMHYNEALSLKEDLIKLGFKDAFIVATNNGKKLSIKEALLLSNETIH